MLEKDFRKFRISSSFRITPGGVNGCCHGLTGGVQPNSKHIVRNPRVMVILWGHYYETSSDAIAYATQLVKDLVTGSFMNNLCQYGVVRGSIAGTATVDTGPLNPAPDTLDKAGVIAFLKQWISGPGGIAPAVNEENLVYFIFPPTTTQLTLNTPKGDVLKGDVDFCGYHDSDKYNQESAKDLFFGIVSTKAAKTNNATAQAFVSALSGCVGHELAESFTDRDGAGYISTPCTNSDGTQQACEIGDICENQASFQYQRTANSPIWSVQQYWSNWDNRCIHGDQPVSLRTFLRSIHFDFSKGLRSLNTPTINLQYIASRE